MKTGDGIGLLDTVVNLLTGSAAIIFQKMTMSSHLSASICNEIGITQLLNSFGFRLTFAARATCTEDMMAFLLRVENLTNSCPVFGSLFIAFALSRKSSHRGREFISDLTQFVRGRV